ncbi:LOW QUALITY PROTEIN: hypothetical protein YC2023_002083 [Brassica napus]
MRYRQLPLELQEHIRFNTYGLHPEASMKNPSLPTDLRQEIQHNLCLYLQIYAERSNAISVSLLSYGNTHQLFSHKILLFFIS